jgi:ABC-type branched-subunit amino acid transport system ATPase component
MLIHSIEIENFRCFKKLRVENLGRVNLIVGTNNSGKTSLLEAIELLACAKPTSPITILQRRGQVRPVVTSASNNSISFTHEFDVRRLFFGHTLRAGAKFSLAADAETGRRVTAGMLHPSETLFTDSVDIDQAHSASADIDLTPLSFILTRAESQADGAVVYPLNAHGTISQSSASTPQSSGRRQPAALTGSPSAVKAERSREIAHRFIGLEPQNPVTVVQRFDALALKPDKRIVIEALQSIEPSLIDIASVHEGHPSLPQELPGFGSRRGFLILLDRAAEPVPISSMGDGIWRILNLVLALIDAKGGVLLIDEIDTGLHHSVMDKMWTLVNETAKRLNIQVFATTHSRDCVMSLATICHQAVSDTSEITIQRLERDQETTVAYTEEEIIAAAKYDVEVR